MVVIDSDLFEEIQSSPVDSYVFLGEIEDAATSVQDVTLNNYMDVTTPRKGKYQGIHV